MFCFILLAAGLKSSQGQILLTASANDLYDTGWSSTGTFNANSNAADPHYTLESIGPSAYPPQVTTLPAPAYGVTNAEVTAAGWSQANSTTGSINANGNTVGATWVSFSATSLSQPNTANLFVYQLPVTNIPVGSAVTITGNFGGDDTLYIYIDGSSTASFTNTNFGTSAPGTLTFTANGSDYINFFVVNANNGGGNTGLFVNDLAGFYVVPEPRDWSLIVLAGVVGLMYLRKLKHRFPWFSLNEFSGLTKFRTAAGIER